MAKYTGLAEDTRFASGSFTCYMHTPSISRPALNHSLAQSNNDQRTTN